MSHMKLRLLSTAIICGGGFTLAGPAQARGPTCAPLVIPSISCPGGPAAFCAVQYGGECGQPTYAFCVPGGIYCQWGDA